MHDPLTQILSLPGFILWHKDPEKDGTDDSCGWFMRSRHGDPATLERIVQRFDYDWDRTFTSDSGKLYHSGYFTPTGFPVLSTHAIALNLFFLAAIEHFSQGPGKWGKARRFMRKHLFDILYFAENPFDSLHGAITQKWGPEKREERVRNMAGVVYSWILRAERPWWKHPRFHFWHWRITCHPWLRLKRRLFTRCCICHKTFGWKETPMGNWGGDRIWHQHCDKHLRPQ